MSGIVASVGSSLLGAYTSDKASKRAAQTAQETSEAQLAYMRESENRARDDINRLYPQATERRNQGYQQQMDFLGSALPVTMDAMQQGNYNAQQVLAGSMPQYQNAILGNAIDYGFAQPQRIDMSSQIEGLLSGLPQLYSPPEQQQQNNNQMPNMDIGQPTGGNSNPFAGGVNNYLPDRGHLNGFNPQNMYRR